MSCLQEMTWLCRACQQRPVRLQLSCIHCGRLQPRGLSCVRCRAHTHLTGVVSAGAYSTPFLQRGIHWLKFKRITAVVPYLAPYLRNRLTAIGPLAQLAHSAALIPIPLHPRRQRERGFNQAHELARALAHDTAIPLLAALTRTRATHFQSHLPQQLRAENVADAFDVQANVRGYRALLLVDDVTTSGATLAAAARALALHTSAAIWGVTLARG